MCGGAAPDHHGHPARIQVELDDITARFGGKEQGIGRNAEECVELFFKEKVERKGLKLSVTEDGKEGKRR